MQQDVSMLHEQVIQTWLLMKESRPDMDNGSLARAVYLAVMEREWPSSLPIGNTAMDVCAAINTQLELPELTAEAFEAFAITATAAHIEAKRIAKVLLTHRLLKIAAALLAVGTTLVLGFNWYLLWIVGLIWVTDRILQTTGVMYQIGTTTRATVVFWNYAHVTALIVAFFYPIWLLAKHFG